MKDTAANESVSAQDSGTAAAIAIAPKATVPGGDSGMSSSITSTSSSPLVNVASAQGGARILFCTDEWFASSDRLLCDDEPTFDPSAYCAQGKVMDGWESRRRRQAGHDWCLIKLTCRAFLSKVSVDTAYFTGNQVPVISLQAIDLSYAQEQSMISRLPGILPRLLYGGQQGTGCTPDQVREAQEACDSIATTMTTNNSAQWTTVLPRSRLNPGYEESRHHEFVLSTTESTDASKNIGATAALPVESSNGLVTATHVRLNYYPDGGVARLRLWGIPHAQQQARDVPALYRPIETGPTCTVVAHSDIDNHIVDLPSLQVHYNVTQVSCVNQGGVGVSCSNQHYGVPSNLIQPHAGVDMGDGWETARHPHRPAILVVPKGSSDNRDAGLVDWDASLSDWCILKLGATVEAVDRIILDTKHFKGNYPESVQVEGCCYAAASSTNDSNDDLSSASWFSLLPRGRLAPHSEHCYDAARNQILNSTRAVSHVRVTMYPDGGLSRVRIYGRPQQG